MKQNLRSSGWKLPERTSSSVLALKNSEGSGQGLNSPLQNYGRRRLPLLRPQFFFFYSMDELLLVTEPRLRVHPGGPDNGPFTHRLQNRRHLYVFDGGDPFADRLQ